MQLAAFNHHNFPLGQAAMVVNEGLPAFLVEQLRESRDLSKDTVAIPESVQRTAEAQDRPNPLGSGERLGQREDRLRQRYDVRVSMACRLYETQALPGGAQMHWT